ncbi:hypothetical protein D0Z08_04950 [Nocardioides immobilis]|uniref:Uncharacterized protein n=1 Tax=Nocardioides immobilis TaxID=2049295 RepID=A0A417Y770_9ACTN|nr:hypothetical protein [Nocardioides immobilis]RHW28324.1 hypothetical protein D0Z08_04950 [Nocardioides immobilis]
MNETPGPTARADLAWGRVTRRSESGSFIEDQLARLVDDTPDAGRFRPDVVYPDLAVGEAG